MLSSRAYTKTWDGCHNGYQRRNAAISLILLDTFLRRRSSLHTTSATTKRYHLSILAWDRYHWNSTVSPWSPSSQELCRPDFPPRALLPCSSHPWLPSHTLHLWHPIVMCQEHVRSLSRCHICQWDYRIVPFFSGPSRTRLSQIWCSQDLHW